MDNPFIQKYIKLIIIHLHTHNYLYTEVNREKIWSSECYIHMIVYCDIQVTLHTDNLKLPFFV